MDSLDVFSELAAAPPRPPASSETLSWFLARDVFVGRNFKTRDFERGLTLASKMQLDDAVSFCRLLATFSAPFSRKRLRKLLESKGDDAQALCLLGLVFGDPDYLQKAVTLGNVLAHGALAAVVVPSRKFRLAAFAARHGDAQGLFVLGCCFEQGVQCSPSLDQAGQCYHEAAKLDWVEAQHRFAVLVLQHGVPERARWLARAARLAHVGGEGFARAFLDELAYAAGYAAPNREMRKLLAGRVRGRHVFGIEATERELEVVSSFLGNKENSGVEEQRLRLELAKERAEKMVLANELESARQKAERCDAARLLSETRVACAQKEMESALQRADELSGKLSELRSAANQLLISLNQSKHTSEPALQNCMQYVHLSKRGVWSTRTLPLPEACLSLLEVFELTPDHPAAGVGGARGVRVRLDAERALKMGETVMYYGGHVRCGLHDGQCDPSDYPCPLNLEQQKSTDPVVDAMYLGSLARFLNDARGGARESNCQTQFDTVRIGGSLVVCVAIRTLRVIHAGEELLIDYGDAYWAAKELRDGPQERAISDLRNKLLHY